MYVHPLLSCSCCTALLTPTVPSFLPVWEIYTLCIGVYKRHMKIYASCTSVTCTCFICFGTVCIHLFPCTSILRSVPLFVLISSQTASACSVKECLWARWWLVCDFRPCLRLKAVRYKIKCQDTNYVFVKSQGRLVILYTISQYVNVRVIIPTHWKFFEFLIYWNL